MTKKVVSVIKIVAPNGSLENKVFSNRNYYHTINVLRNMANLLEDRIVKLKHDKKERKNWLHRQKL